MILKTTGKNVIEFQIDNEDYIKVSCLIWGATLIKKNWYVRNAVRIRGVTTIIPLQNFILDFPDCYCVDHKNGNTLDYRKENLRACSRKENVRNSPIHKNNTSGFKGVVRGKNGNRWNAKIYVDGVSINLGWYPSAELAHGAYIDAANKHHGNFARGK